MKNNSKYFEYVYSANNVLRWKGQTPIGRDSAGISAGRAAFLYFILCSLEEELTGRKVSKKDKGLVGIILRGVTAKDRGDMRFSTKTNPKLATLKKQGEKILLDNFFDGLSTSIQPFLRESIDLYNGNQKVSKLMRLAKKFDAHIFARRELMDYNNTMFNDLNQQTFNCLQEAVYDSGLKSAISLLKSIQQKDSLYSFIMKFYDMDKEYRWDTFERVTPQPEDDDAIHSFRVAANNLFMGAIEKYKYGKKVDFYSLILRPLFHDLQEVEVGDIIMPIKYSTEAMKKAVHEYEDGVAEQMIQDIKSNNIKAELTKYFVNAKNDSLEGELTDLSDKLDSLLFCLLKMNQGSLIFKESFKINLRIMQSNYEEECFKFFLAYVLYDLIK